MRPAANHTDVLRQPVIAGVSVRMEPAGELLERSLGVAGLSVGPVLIEDHRLRSVFPCSVEPHVALGLCGLARLLQHLKRGFIGVKDRLFHKSLFHFLIDRRQPVVGSTEDPVGHGLPGKLDAGAVQFLLLPI